MLGFVVGFAHHGDSRIAFLEMRPYVYLAASFFLASRLGTTERSLRVALWAIVLASGLKAVQGLVVFLQVRHMDPRPDSVLAHEEALFLGIFLLLVLALWWFEMPGRLRTTAMVFLPFVLATRSGQQQANGVPRSSASASSCSRCSPTSRLPESRLVLRRMLAGLLVFSAFYLPAYWNKTGALAQPAVAVHSAVLAESARRVVRPLPAAGGREPEAEHRRGRPARQGLRRADQLRAPDRRYPRCGPAHHMDPARRLLYVLDAHGRPRRHRVLVRARRGHRWARAGSCGLAIARLAPFGAIVVCLLFAYVLEGYKDQGFFYFRVALVVGTMLGLTQAALRREAARVDPVDP